MLDMLRELIREEIKKLIQDDALFRREKVSGIVGHRDEPGIESEFAIQGDDCPSCEKLYPDQCPSHRISGAQSLDIHEI
jgi:hypothetical protein